MMHTVRVYYEDTDAGGVVHHGAYLNFLERARTEWLRQKGFEQRRLFEEDGLFFVVRKLSVEYKAPAVLDDSLQVSVQPMPAGRTSLFFEQRICRADDELLTASTLIVCVGGTPFRPTPLPPAMVALLPSVR